MTYDPESLIAILGRVGEMAASEALQLKHDDASVIALCRIENGGAPSLEFGSVRRSHRVLPDIQLFNWEPNPGACFLEIKTYSHAGVLRMLSDGDPNKERHGITVRHYEHFRGISERTKLPVFLGVNDLEIGKLIVSPTPLLDMPKLRCVCRGGCRSANSNLHIPSGRGIQEMQWYFPRSAFSLRYDIATKTIEKLRSLSSVSPTHTISRHGEKRSVPTQGAFSFDTPKRSGGLHGGGK